ncbi:hypothetical protein F6P96_09895 [Escherichia coli]|nr:hypothetical protein F6P96_09895 [Escherichia coli]
MYAQFKAQRDCSQNAVAVRSPSEQGKAPATTEVSKKRLFDGNVYFHVPVSRSGFTNVVAS